MSKILLIIGTRPELIKVAPIALELIRRGFKKEFAIVNTAQHKDILSPYWNIFNLKPDYILDVMEDGQSLSALTSRAISQLENLIQSLESKPKLILAQGDTTTVMVSSIVAFYNKIKFVHLEAGLRSFDFENPFPEEYNRKIAAINAFVHFTPTEKAKINLIHEGYNEESIITIGNTVIDSLNFIIKSGKKPENFENPKLKNLKDNKKNVLITCHRRENHGKNLLEIIEAIYTLANRFMDYTFVWVLHPNPAVKAVVEQSNLVSLKNVILTRPLNYFDLIKFLKTATIVITDSGGIQEEAPSFNLPALILRVKTERPEGVDLGIAKLVGSDKNKIIEEFEILINSEPLKNIKNPYGDGEAARRCVDKLLELIN